MRIRCGFRGYAQAIRSFSNTMTLFRRVGEVFGFYIGFFTFSPLTDRFFFVISWFIRLIVIVQCAFDIKYSRQAITINTKNINYVHPASNKTRARIVHISRWISNCGENTWGLLVFINVSFVNIFNRAVDDYQLLILVLLNGSQRTFKLIYSILHIVPYVY